MKALTISPKRQHPIAILQYTFRYLFFLLVPLFRGVGVITGPADLYHWIRGAWIDLAAIGALLLFPFLEWCRHTYALTEEGFVLRRGILMQRESFIPRRYISTLTVERPFYLRLIGAVRLSVDTDAGSSLYADFRLTVGRKHAETVLSARKPPADTPTHHYRPAWYWVVILSLLASNSFSGVLLLATTLRQVGIQLGEGIQQQLIGNLETVTGYVTVLPRTAALIAFILLLGWAVAAIRTMLRLLPFRVTRHGNVLHIRTGLFVQRNHICTVSSINYADFRQSLMCKLLQLHLVFISCIGYGKGKNAMAVLLPTTPLATVDREMAALLPDYYRRPVTLKAAPFSLYRYCFYPLWGMVLLYPSCLVLQHIFPQWQELIYYLTFMTYIPCAWLLAVKIIDRYTAGIAYSDGFFSLRYSRHFSLHTLLIPQEKVVSYTLRQSFPQKLAKNCDLLLYTYNERQHYHCIKNIPLDKATALLQTAFPEEERLTNT